MARTGRLSEEQRILVQEIEDFIERNGYTVEARGAGPIVRKPRADATRTLIALDCFVAEVVSLKEALAAFFAEFDSGDEYAHCAPTDATEAKMRAALEGTVVEGELTR